MGNATAAVEPARAEAAASPLSFAVAPYEWDHGEPLARPARGNEGAFRHYFSNVWHRFTGGAEGNDINLSLRGEERDTYRPVFGTVRDTFTTTGH